MTEPTPTPTPSSLPAPTPAPLPSPLPSPLTGQPQDDHGPVFAAPWQAQAFAIAVSLHQRGVFTWNEWADTLAGTIADAQARGDPDLGGTYYEHWLSALERLVALKGASTSDELAGHREAWEHAAARTPHGHPIELRASDFGQSAGGLTASSTPGNRAELER